MDNVHTSSPEVVPDSPASPSHPEICSEPHGCKYFHQQTINLHQRAAQLCIDNLPADEIANPGHVHDIYSADYEACSSSAQSLKTVQILYLNYISIPPDINAMNNAGMLGYQNFPGG